ncbi:hypothetical protein H4219_001607 [Mycoemilia scoparia]|uniref:Nuclear speckle splicing regulatory protein 1 N-terminal domain-containing protein n=1 Tax=Mycoemilia scoparia TaxID=417184 RepID=A0A9W8DRQ1_9FUNG|nr:hypothetical protein H4219_001607 [Mycoemilia scoparia]
MKSTKNIKLKYGLNLRKPTSEKTKDPKYRSGSKVSSAFGEDNEDDNNANQDKNAANVFGGKSSDLDQAKMITNKELIAMAAKQKEIKSRQETVEDIDPSIYDYDGAYDVMKSAEKAAKDQIRSEKHERKSKYIDALLKTAERRKFDQARVKEKIIQKEREAEGELYADKEKFVTTAYKEQMEEMRRLEEEEKLKEEAEDVTKRKDMTGFYQNYIDETDKATSAARQASFLALQKPIGESTKESSDNKHHPCGSDKKDSKIKDYGKDVTLNDDNEVVDKRELLKSGINIINKPGVSTKSRRHNGLREHDDDDNRDRSRGSRYRIRDHDTGHRNDQKYNRHRSRRGHDNEGRSEVSRYIEKQIENNAKEDQELQEHEREKLARMNKRHNTEESVMSARERYLARKKAKSQQQESQ